MQDKTTIEYRQWMGEAEIEYSPLPMLVSLGETPSNQN